MEVEGQRKLQPACNTFCCEGLVVRTNTDNVKWARRMVLEYYLIHHPLDCPICDKAGECKLQDFTFSYGPRTSRFKYPKKATPVKSLGPKLNIDMDRCVLCTRCVRFLREIVKEEELIVAERGDNSEITTPPGKEVVNNYACFTSDICPVGALTIKKFRFNFRVFMQSNKISVCPFCESLCSINVGVWRGKLVRVISGNPEQEFICDEGRFNSFELLTHRYKDYPVEVNEKGERRVFDYEVSNILSSFQKGDGICLSPWITLETGLSLKKWGEEKGLRFFKLAHKTGEEDSLILKSIRAPNVRGIDEIFENAETVEDLKEALNKGELKKLLLVHPAPKEQMEALKVKAPLVIYAGLDLPEIDAEKLYYIPCVTHFETGGTFKSSLKEVKFEPVISPEPGVYDFSKMMERKDLYGEMRL